MKRRSFILAGWTALVAGASALVGCGSVNYLTGCGPVARRPNVIPDTAIRMDPRLAEGQRVFMNHCNQCHVGGAAGVGPALVDKRIPEFLIRFQVRHGLGAMPAFSERAISDGQLEDVLNYLRYLRRHPNGPTV
ncbi:MAG TPA: c-type cytochrome [Tepidisphaeraceae bacterium]|nr:c-type cytochrome [Tepidisphaeraceae bacterium]